MSLRTSLACRPESKREVVRLQHPSGDLPLSVTCVVLVFAN